jgi:phosphoglucomutase
MVLSASGWRGVFAEDGGDESSAPGISRERRAVAAAGALFADLLKRPSLNTESSRDVGVGTNVGVRDAENGTNVVATDSDGEAAASSPSVVVGMDSRPTGPAIADTVIRALLARSCNVRFLGVAAAPEIMAYTRSLARVSKTDGGCADGFVYISASHNPIGHNGIKFGFTDGGVLPGSEALKLTDSLRAFFTRDNAVEDLLALVTQADESRVRAVYESSAKEKAMSLAAYEAFSREIWTDANEDVYQQPARNSVKASQSADETGAEIAVVADLNGSARCASIDKAFFTSLGIPFKTLNAETGRIAHRIVPEGESLSPCCRFLEEAHREKSAFVLGYVCDCDGDRGNLVIWDDKRGAARPLGAQEVFALAVLAELAQLAWTNGGVLPPMTGVVVNDATSMRVDRIAAAFGAQVFRAEVGEANVVSLAREVRERGWTVRILGEGAAGGNITHPGAVRDPLATVMAIVKLLAIRRGKTGGLYKIWCDASGQQKLYRDNFTLSDIIESLPAFVTTSSYEKEAILNIGVEDHGRLKARYQEIFEREWEARREGVLNKYDVVAYEAQAYKGTAVFRSCKNYAEAGRGGLRIVFFRDRRGSDSVPFAFIWMRGSGTEKAFRIMADVQGDDTTAEREFLAWQTRMVEEAADEG